MLKLTLPPVGSVMLSTAETHYEGTVLQRDNRFIVTVAYNGQRIECHLHDPGRLKELIFPGNRVLFRDSPGKRTRYSITAGMRDGDWILTDSRFHNRLASMFLPEGTEREVSLGKSRIDFRWNDTYIEVKGCSMLAGEMAVFPDAPTIRGTHHLKLLTDIMRNGGNAMLAVLIFSHRAGCFSPNFQTDPEFGSAFSDLIDAGGAVFLPKFSLEYGKIIFRGTTGICREYFR